MPLLGSNLSLHPGNPVSLTHLSLANLPDYSSMHTPKIVLAVGPL
jgi:hypothetical protein